MPTFNTVAERDAYYANKLKTAGVAPQQGNFTSAINNAQTTRTATPTATKTATPTMAQTTAPGADNGAWITTRPTATPAAPSAPASPTAAASTQTPTTEKLNIPVQEPSKIEAVVTQSVTDSDQKKEAEAQVQADYYKLYETGEKFVKEGIWDTNPYPATYSEYQKQKEAQNKAATDYQTKQNDIAKQIDESQLGISTKQGKSAISGVEAAMAQSREGVTGTSKPLAAQSFTNTQNTIINNAALQVQSAQNARDENARLLAEAQKQGRTKDAEIYSGLVAQAEKDIKQAKTDLADAQTKATNSALDLVTKLNLGAMDLSDDDINALSTQTGADPTFLKLAVKSSASKSIADVTKARLDNQTTALNNFKEMVTQGVAPSDDYIQSISEATGVDMGTLSQYVKAAQSTLNDTKLDQATKQANLDTTNFNLSQKLRGITNAELEKVDYLQNLYNKGASEQEIINAKKVLGIKDEDDPMYMAQLNVEVANAAIKQYEAENQGKPPKEGTKEWIDYMDKKVSMAKTLTEMEDAGYDTTELKNQIGGTTGGTTTTVQTKLPDSDYKSIFMPTGSSKYGHAANHFECGEGYNKLTDGAKVGDDYSTKMAIVTKRNNPQVGNALVIPLSGAGSYGHIETVIRSDGNNITTVSFNRDRKGTQTIQNYTVDQLNKKYGNNWGFSDSKLKPQYQKELDNLAGTGTTTTTIFPTKKETQGLDKTYSWASTLINSAYGDTEGGKAAKRYNQEFANAIAEGRGDDAKMIITNAITAKMPAAQQSNFLDALDTKNAYDDLSTALDDYKKAGLDLGLANKKVSEIQDALRTKRPDEAVKLQARMEQAFNSYRKAITGAGASTKELDRLAESFPTYDKNISTVSSMLEVLQSDAQKKLDTRIKQYSGGKFKTYDDMNQTLDSIGNISTAGTTDTGKNDLFSTIGAGVAKYLQNNLNEESADTNHWNTINTTKADNILSQFNTPTPTKENYWTRNLTPKK